MEALRYLPMDSSADNPSALPIGFALDARARGESWVGLTCAACHTNQLNYSGKRILIEGAPTLANFVQFFDELTDALIATSEGDEKFERFAQKVLAEKYGVETAQTLRSRLLEIALKMEQRRAVNELPAGYPADFTSYARLDAFGNIQNAGSAFALHDLDNKNAPTAPVSYPFLWGTHQSDVVQWNASAPNTPVVGPLVRNIGEVIGVFGGLSIEQAPWPQRLWGKKQRYFSTADMIGLGHLEAWVKQLRSPAWPQQYLPAIDVTKAVEGARLYQKHCSRCHQVIARSKEGENYVAVKTPVAEVGTDPAMAWNAEHHMAKSLLLEGTKSKILIGEDFAEITPALGIAVNGAIGLTLKSPGTALEAGMMSVRTARSVESQDEKTLEEHVEDHAKARERLTGTRPGYISRSPVKELDGLVYKARPLNGIWATAPYLHNGSVPTLWQLMQRPEERMNQFWVGSREFDPVNVGYEAGRGLSKFNVLDDGGEIQQGNSNRGHAYGTNLTDEQKWSLIEYMKTL